MGYSSYGHKCVHLIDKESESLCAQAISMCWSADE